MATEKEDLDQLVHSDGWLRVTAFAAREWGDERIVADVFAALGDRDGAIAVDKARQVAAVAIAVKRLIQWPGERLKSLERAETGRIEQQLEPLSRRGSL